MLLMLPSRVESDLPCFHAVHATVTCGERLALLSCCSCYRHVWRADATVTCGERLAVLSYCSCYRHVWTATCPAFMLFMLPSRVESDLPCTFMLFMLPSRVDSDLPCFHAVHATVTCGERLAVLSCCSCYRHVWTATCPAFMLFMLPSRVDSVLSCCSCYRHVWRATCFHAVHATVTTSLSLHSHTAGHTQLEVPGPRPEQTHRKHNKQYQTDSQAHVTGSSPVSTNHRV